MVCVDEMDTAYLDNLDEYINDEGRIVSTLLRILKEALGIVVKGTYKLR